MHHGCRYEGSADRCQRNVEAGVQIDQELAAVSIQRDEARNESSSSSFPRASRASDPGADYSVMQYWLTRSDKEAAAKWVRALIVEVFQRS